MIKKGDLLISEPFLPDPNFVRSVIILAEHGSQGSLGFILNQPATMILDDLGDEFTNIELPIYVGGPVEQNTLHFLHTYGDNLEGALKITDTLYWSGNLNKALELIRLGVIKPEQIRFFLGYSGWSKGQLNLEYKKKTWIVIDSVEDDLFGIEPTELWRQVLRKKGGKLKEISNYPIDPRLN